MNDFLKYSYTFLLCCIFPLLSFGQCEVMISDTFVCHFGNNITLSPEIVGSSITHDYRVDEIPFNYLGHQNSNIIDLEDDDISQAIDIGFDFEFYGNIYSQIYIGSNGWVSFENNQSVNYLSTPIPSSDIFVPKNTIFAAWEDWNPSIGGTISYELFEEDEGSYFVVSFESLSHYLCGSDLETQGSFQIILNQTDYSITNNIINKSSCLTVPSLQGIINDDGSRAVTFEGRNSTVWSSNFHSSKYTPSNFSYFNWLVDDILVHQQDSLNLNFFTSQDVVLQFWDDLGCSSEVDFMVSVLPEYELSIDRVEDVLYSSLIDDNHTYQWYFNGEELEGEINSSLTLITEGQYFVQVQNLENGCFYNSRVHLYVTANILESDIALIKTFPQPSNGSFSINTDKKVSLVEIFDNKGVMVDKILKPKSNNFHVDLSSGIYFANFYMQDKKYFSRLIISN
jgi:hypothetical protein